MTERNYSTSAQATTLSSPLGTTGNPVVASMPGTWPSSYPYTALIDWGNSSQEAVLVTGAPTGSGPYTLPCTRGTDGTSGVSHLSGAAVVHGTTAYEPSHLQLLMLIPTPVKTSGYTAAPQDLVLCDASGSSFTVTLPSAPADRTRIAVMAAKSPGSNTITVACSGSDVFNDTATVTWAVTAAAQCLVLQYDTSLGAWITASGSSAGGGAVSSVFGRTGAVTAQSGDYTAAETGALAGASQVTFTFGSTGGAPSSGSWTAGQAATDQAGVLRVCTASGSPGTWQRAGQRPDQFYADDYGAKGNMLLVSDGAMSSSSNPTHLACTTSTPFASGDVGKTVYVVGAGAAGADLFTTVSSFTDSGHVVLAAGASTTVSAAGVAFGTDDTAAIQNTVSAAVTWAEGADTPDVRVLFGAKIYGCNSAPTIGGTPKCNAILTLPIVPVTSQKVVLTFEGAGWGADAQAHWDQTVPQTSGTMLLTTRLDGTVDGTYWQAFILSGPYAGYGAATSLFSNMQVIIDGIRFGIPWNSTYGGVSLLGVAEARVLSAGVQAMAINVSGAWPHFQSGGPTSGTSSGIVMPDINNNDLSDIAFYGAEGVGAALIAPEHVTFGSMHVLYCGTAVEPVSPSGTAAAHNSVTGKYLSVENCYAAVGNYSGAAGKVAIDCVDEESITYVVADSSNGLTGYVGVVGNNTPGYNTMASQGAAGVRIRYLGTVPGPLASQPAVPANNTAFPNWYYADAMVYITSGGAAVSAIAVGGTATGLTLGTSGTVAVEVPAGQSITLTYASTAPTWKWFLR